MHRAGLVVLVLSVNLLGCPEYLDEGGDTWFDMSFNAIFHRGDWGGDAVDCRLEVAFLELGSGDGFVNGEGAVTTIPAEAGQCAVSYFDRDTEQAQGSLSVSGALEAGETVWIETQGQTLDLVRSETVTGAIVYALQECDESVFPFAQALDLTVPGSETSNDVPGFSLQRALGVGRDMVLLQPGGAADEAGAVELYQDQDLELVWEYAGEPLELGEGVLEPVPIVFVRNQEPDGFLFEAAACRLDDTGEFTIPAEVFGQLTPQPADDPYYYTTSLQLDASASAGEIPIPWGAVTERRSTISDGGFLRLLATP